MKRFWEIDFLRGTAIIMMIFYHFLYDLNFFNILTIPIRSGFWWFFARITASIFIFLVGVSLTLSYHQFKKKNPFNEYLKRGLKIFSYGLLITLATWIFLHEGFIIFGILHFIGLSIIIGYPFIRYKGINLMFGLIIILLGLYLQTFRFDFPWLLWIGLIPNNLYTVDYFPLLPWFGLVLIGIWFGNTFYENHKRKLQIPEISNIFVRTFSFLGRNSLIIYLLHQPILILFIYLLV